MKLENIVITGATSELAVNLANRANELGFNLILISRGEQKKLAPINGTIIKQMDGIDLSDELQQTTIRELIENTFHSKFGLIHFAGDFWTHKPLVHTEFSEIKGMMNSHYFTLCNVVQVVTPIMIKLGGGKLIAFSCNSVSYNYPDMIPFTCAKSAIETFIKCYGNEYAEYGINSLAIALPTILTERVKQEKPNGDHENYVTPQEVSDIIIEQLIQLNQFVNGNVVKIFRHSTSFYNQGYFERNPRIKRIDENGG